MAFRAPLRLLSRRMSTLSVDKNPTKGPKIPAGNDPSATHGTAHALADTNRWRYISFMFGLPVLGFGIIQQMKPHEHADPPVEYPYLRIGNKVPRFPWGDDDLIGTSYERHAKEHAAEGHH